MHANINGELKKVACGPCIRGHRSSKCDHGDRVLVEVRKPGRPLSSCPHPTGSCSCERIIINYTIPKSSECACPPDRGQSVVAGNSRIQKHRRKSTAISAATLEKVFKREQDVETDASSATQALTETSGSNEVTPASSASSTPRLQPTVSSCCQPKPLPQPLPQPINSGGCCSSKAKESPQPGPLPVRSCCSGKGPAMTIANTQANTYMHSFPSQFQFQSQIHTSRFGSPPLHMLPSSSLPYGFGTPIYTHAPAAYQHQPTALNRSTSLPPLDTHAPAHNCQCGDSCSCFGCAAHPENATMMEYVRLMAQFQDTGGLSASNIPLYDLPTYPHHPGFGGESNFAPFRPNLSGMPTPRVNPTYSHLSTFPAQPWPSAPQAVGPLLTQFQTLEPSSYMSSPIPSSLLHPTNHAAAPLHTALHLTTKDATSTPPVESPIDSAKDDDAATLSPSSYFWNQMILPGCGDATGTCQCGDGCGCVECLTYGAHNGILLEKGAGREEAGSGIGTAMGVGGAVEPGFLHALHVGLRHHDTV